MATNLGTANGTVFNTANMKPESDDQTDALWGQNLADNLAYLRINGINKPVIQMGPTLIESSASGETIEITGTQQFLFNDWIGTLCGTYNYGTYGIGAFTSDGFNAYVDRGTVITEDTGEVEKRAGFRIPISHFPAGSNGKSIDVSFTLYGELTGANQSGLILKGFTSWLEP